MAVAIAHFLIASTESGKTVEWPAQHSNCDQIIELDHTTASRYTRPTELGMTCAVEQGKH